MAAAKVDLKRQMHELYAPGREPELVDVPELAFIMLDGHGDPNTAPVYTRAIEALYTVAYTVKFALKRAPEGIDFGVMPLEGLWWAADMASFTTGEKSDWDWTMMIMQPEEVTAEIFEPARSQAAEKKPLQEIGSVRLECFAEGRAAQVLHVGPYAAEGPTIERLHAYITEQGCVPAGKHHEIYLGDPRRSAPEKLRTIVRQPVAPAA